MRFILFIEVLLISMAMLFTACQDKEKPLPIIGFKQKDANGKEVDHRIPDFSFINQDSQIVNNATFAGKAYVVDFFFIHCPTICPKVKKQMLRIYEAFEEEDNLALLSHSIDVKHDTVPALRAYAEKLDIHAPKWHLVTGNHDQIFEIADDYFSTALVNTDAPGGFDHSGLIILVDENRHVRAFADGTNPEDVTRLIGDIHRLLAEQK